MTQTRGTDSTRGTDRPAATPASGRGTMEKQEDAVRTGTPIETRIEECLGLLRQQMRKSDPQELDATLDLFQKALRRPAAPRPSAKLDLVQQLSGGRSYTPAQAAGLELRAAQDAFARRRQLLAGLPDVLRALDASLLGKASWLMRANPYLEGRTPLEALRGGDLERVLDQARAVGAL